MESCAKLVVETLYFMRSGIQVMRSGGAVGSDACCWCVRGVQHAAAACGHGRRRGQGADPGRAVHHGQRQDGRGGALGARWRCRADVSSTSIRATAPRSQRFSSIRPRSAMPSTRNSCCRPRDRSRRSGSRTPITPDRKQETARVDNLRWIARDYVKLERDITALTRDELPPCCRASSARETACR